MVNVLPCNIVKIRPIRYVGEKTHNFSYWLKESSEALVTHSAIHMHAGWFVYRVDSRTATAKSVHLSRFSIVEQVAISSCLTELHEHHCQFDSAFDNCTVSCEIVLLIQLSVNSIVDACCKQMTSSFLTSPDNSPKESAPLLVTRSDTCTPTHQRFQHTGVQIPTG